MIVSFAFLLTPHQHENTPNDRPEPPNEWNEQLSHSNENIRHAIGHETGDDGANAKKEEIDNPTDNLNVPFWTRDGQIRCLVDSFVACAGHDE